MQEYLHYGIIILGLMSLGTLFWNYKLQKKIASLSNGKNGSSLEKIITETHTLANEMKTKHKNHDHLITELQSDLAKCAQNISVTRFDALGDSGGRQSFAIGITDAHKNGVVISSMYSRAGMNVFAKEITKGSSKHTLTEEEKKVIN